MSEWRRTGLQCPTYERCLRALTLASQSLILLMASKLPVYWSWIETQSLRHKHCSRTIRWKSGEQERYKIIHHFSQTYRERRLRRNISADLWRAFLFSSSGANILETWGKDEPVGAYVWHHGPVRTMVLMETTWHILLRSQPESSNPASFPINQ